MMERTAKMELGFRPENQTVRTMGPSDYPKIGTRSQNPTVQAAGMVTNQELVQPHKVDFYSRSEAVLFRLYAFTLRTTVGGV